MANEVKVNSVYPKIHKIMSQVDYIQKDEEVKFGNGKGYKVVSGEKLFLIIRKQFIAEKLIVIPITMKQLNLPIGIEETEKGPIVGKRVLTSVDISFTIIDIETGDQIIASTCGSGADELEKGVRKAITGAYKALFEKLLLISTGDDPDKFASDGSMEIFGSPTVEIPPIDAAPAGTKSNPMAATVQPTQTTPKLTKDLMGAILTEFQFNSGKDGNYCKLEFFKKMNFDGFSKIPAASYPELLKKIQEKYEELSTANGIVFKTPVLDSTAGKK